MNSTINGSSCSSPLNPTGVKIGHTIAYSLALVVSLVGNFLIVITVFKTQSLRKPTNYLIANMSLSDLLFPIFVFPQYLTDFTLGSLLVSGPLGQALCKISSFLANASTAVSIQSLVLIAVDRFVAVVFPLRLPLISSKLCTFIILATWIVAMVVISPYLFALKLVKYPGKLVCELRWSEAFGRSSSEADMYVALYVVFHYVPVALLIILYSIILIKLKSQKIPGEQSDRAEQQRERRNRNVLKMAIAIVFGFVLCWLPFSILNLLKYFSWDRKFPCGILLSADIAYFITHAYCVINPFICFLFSGKYRQGLKRLFTC